MATEIVVAQLNYIPLYTENPQEKIDDLLEMAAQHNLEMDVSDLSTTVRGSREHVFGLIREIYDTMALEGEKFRFHVHLLSPQIESEE